jgi:ABC-type multidrug transport system fused ATPase/permease subunit
VNKIFKLLKVYNKGVPNIFFLNLIVTIFDSLIILLVLPLFQLLSGTLDNNNFILLVLKNFFKTDISVYIICLTLLICLSFKFVFSVILQKIVVNFSFNYEVCLSDKIYNSYLTQKVLDIKKKDSSLILNETLSQSANIVEFGIKVITIILADLLLIFGILIVWFIAQPKLTLFSIILVGIVIYLITFFISLKLKRLGKIKTLTDAKRLNFIDQTLGLFEDIKLYGLEEKYKKLFATHNTVYANILGQQFFFSFLARFIIEFFLLLLCIITIYYIYDYKLVSSNFFPLLAFYGAGAFKIVPALSRLQYYFFHINFAYNIYQKLNLFKNSKPLKELKNTSIEKYNFSFQKIKITDINYAYPSTKKKILSKANLELEQGQIIGLTGQSGSGKSTFVSLLAGFLSPDKGVITTDGKNIMLDIKSWQKNISYISQKIFLINGSINKNLKIHNSREFSHKDYFENNLIKILIKNFNKKQKIWQNGKNLSGGQVQRIAIARAIYNRSKILILDETTNSLDKKNEKFIFNTLKKYVKNRLVVLVISHDLSTLKYCDKIYKLYNKSIVRIK